MKIKQHLFPVILLAMFFVVIAVGMASGYWQTQGGGRHGHAEAAVPVEVALDMAGG